MTRRVVAPVLVLAAVLSAGSVAQATVVGRAAVSPGRAAVSAGPAAVSPGRAPLSTDDPTPSPTAPPDDESPLRVAVTTLAPRAPQPDGLLQVAGTLTNVGSREVSRIRLRLRVGDRITNRPDLHAADTERPPTVRRFGTDTDPVVTNLAPGASTTFDLRTPVANLTLGELGVYPLDIEALGSTRGSFGRVGLAPTWLPWFAGQPVRPTRVAVVLPLVDTPRRTPDDIQLDDTLAGSLEPTGRLGRSLALARAAATGQCDPAALPPTPAAGTPPPSKAATARAAARAAAQRAGQRCDPVPVTLAVDPDLLDTVASMTKPYLVRRPQQPSRTQPGTGTVAATDWLASLRIAASESAPIELPYADPDVVALSRGAPGRGDLAQAMALGRGVARDVLGGGPPLTSVALPPAGTVTPAAVDALTADGTRALVLSPSAFPRTQQVDGRTPGARTALPPSVSGAPVDALVTDDALSQLLTGVAAPAQQPNPAATSRLVEQRFLVETAIIAAERPGDAPRTFVLALPRRGGVALGAAAAAVRDLGRLPWLCPVPLADVATGSEHCPGTLATGPADTDERPPLRTDPSGRLATAYLMAVARDRDAGGQLVDGVLAPDDATSVIRSRLRRAVARAESSAWRRNSAGARVAASGLHQFVTDLVDKVSVRSGGTLLLTSTKGTLTVTLENTLRTAIQCRVRFLSPTAKLSTAQTSLITLGPGKAVQASVRASARTSGQFVVLAQMVDRDGRPFRQPARIVVRSTRYGTLALGVTGLAAAVLLIAAGVRITRRALGRGPTATVTGTGTAGEPDP